VTVVGAVIVATGGVAPLPVPPDDEPVPSPPSLHAMSVTESIDKRLNRIDVARMLAPILRSHASPIFVGSELQNCHPQNQDVRTAKVLNASHEVDVEQGLTEARHERTARGG
jgi:hypothetical protein